MHNKKHITSTDIAQHFEISSQDINKILSELGWISKKDKWWIATIYGKKHGAIEQYNPKNKQKYVVWKDDVFFNEILIKHIDDFKIKTINNKVAKTKKEKLEKGAMYEIYVANHFRELGHIVYEHGREKGVEDGGMDLFVKDGQNIYFVQCKNWSTWKIDLNTIQATQMKIQNLLNKKRDWKELFKNYKSKIMFVAPSGLEKGAYRYIEENSDELEFRKIEI